MLSQALSYRNFSETVDGSEILHQLISWEPKGTPPEATPPIDKALLRDY